MRLLAVSKTRTADDLRAAVAAGQTAFGENYLQEALDKIDALADIAGIDWHFIGRSSPTRPDKSQPPSPGSTASTASRSRGA